MTRKQAPAKKLLKSHNHLVWIDLEMTGLDHRHDQIIEIATVVTDAELTVLAEGPNLAIQTDPSALAAMGAWCQKHHGASGLTERALKSQTTLAQAEQATLAFLRDWVPAQTTPMCGNSICQDRRFLIEQMPALEAFFHYRNLDVSSLKELAKRWQPQVFQSFKKQGAHLALDDIYESIAELKHYRHHWLDAPHSTH